jgi:hypothetical protein
LALLAKAGLVAREARGTSVYYRIADPAIYRLCDLVCGQLAQHFAGQAELHATFGGRMLAPASGKKSRIGRKK